MTFVLGTTSGGTGTHVRSLAAGLCRRGIEVTVAGPAETEHGRGFTPAGACFVPVDIAARPRPARDLVAVIRLRRLLRPAPAPRVVHAHGLRAGALAAAALRARLPATRSSRASRLAVPPALVVTVHNAPPAGGPAVRAIYDVLERIVARHADRVLYVSGDLGERMRRRGARSAGRAIVPAPVAPSVPDDMVRATRADLTAADRPVVLAVGRLAAQKGFGTLLDAAAFLRDLDPRPLVAIAGSGPLRVELSRRIEAQRLPVRLLGQRADVPALLAAADVFVLPSVWEGQPLVLQEALRAGAAIVATRAGGIPELTGESAALLVPAGAPRRLADAISRLLTEPGLAARLSAAATERAGSLPGDTAAVDAVLTDYAHALRDRDRA